MKASLHIVALLFAASIPVLFIVEFSGAILPASLNPLTALFGFAATQVLLTAINDYARSRYVPGSIAVPAALAPKAAHPLAA